MPRPARAPVVDLIVEAAAAYPAAVGRRRGGELTLTLTVQHITEQVEYLLRISAMDAVVRVREEAPARLPAFCPERHINVGGWFCLEFEEVDGIRVVDSHSAVAWWRRLWKFLQLQRSAAKMRRWPNSQTWAHGDAAKHQRAAEVAAAALGLEAALAAGELQVRKLKGFLAVYQGPRRLFSIWRDAKRIATGRQACLCGSGRPRIHCTDHAAQAVALAMALDAWRREEADFWRHVADKLCCGTMAVCPLRKLLPGPRSSNEDATPVSHAA